MSCDVGKAREGLENEVWRRWSGWKLGAHSPSFQSLQLRHSSFLFSKLSVASPTSHLILQPSRRFTYVTPNSPTLPSLYLRHNSFSNPSVASPTWQLILQTFFRFSYVTGFSLTSPGEPPMEKSSAFIMWFEITSYKWINVNCQMYVFHCQTTALLRASG